MHNAISTCREEDARKRLGNTHRAESDLTSLYSFRSGTSIRGNLENVAKSQCEL